MEYRDTSVESIGLFIDGGYYAKVNESLEKYHSKNINMTALMAYIRGYVSGLSGKDIAACHITESHYFRGRYRAGKATHKHLLYEERQFEDSLIENDVIFHYKHLRDITESDGSVTVIEKGIDVWFALEAYELATIRRFDFVVLITGDADHEMLIRKLKALKIPVILLTWDVSKDQISSTAPLLREEACIHVELSKKIAEDYSLMNKLCRDVSNKHADAK